MIQKRIHYLDNAASSPVSPESRDALFILLDQYANPSSLHQMGLDAEHILEDSRKTVAASLSCAPGEIIFTSGGTESDNIAIFGAAQAMHRRGKHIITTEIEHQAVLGPVNELERRGFSVTRLRPNLGGVISVADFDAALREDTILASIMLVNNETGALQPVGELAAVLKRRRSIALFHCDAVQGYMKTPVKADALGADLISLSGHKCNAPKGVGALYVRKGTRILPRFYGGGQEKNLRSGTEPVPLIGAFAAAVRAGTESLKEDAARMARLKAEGIGRIRAKVPGVHIFGENGICHIFGLSLSGQKSETMLHRLEERGVYVSSGSACGKGKPSHVLQAMGITRGVADAFLRVSLSRYTTEEDIEALAAGLAAMV